MKYTNFWRSAKLFLAVIIPLSSFLFSLSAEGAVARKSTGGAKGTAMITTSSTAQVREKKEYTGFDQECSDAFVGCMDQFCISENENGGSCQCSDDYKQYSEQMARIEKNNDEANRLSTIEVERVKAGANADIIFTGQRKYDEKGNVIQTEDDKAAAKAERKKARQLNLDSLIGSVEDDAFEDDGSLDGLTGGALYSGARDLCMMQIPEKCQANEMNMIQQVYKTNIKNDCVALGKVIKDLEKKSELAIIDAQKDVADARAEALAKDNEYNRGECMVEFKKCMQTEDACGNDWNRCVRFTASDNMQNIKANSTAGTKVKSTTKFTISEVVQEMLDSKKFICERVLDKCQASRDFVWDDFLRDVAPEIKLAEAKAESVQRQSCLTDISACIQKACKDDIAGKGEETMDSCLSRPDMARSFCKIEIDPCERMEPLIWDYVLAKFASLRVDACTAEVKECFASPDRCGDDMSQCWGLDFKYLHQMCPVDKLVVCKQTKKDFTLADIDDMMMGFFLNFDNAMLEQCEELADEKMQEICGSTVDCNKFAADDTLGSKSIQYNKVGSTHRITGLISFGQIKMGNGLDVIDGAGHDPLPAGEIGIEEYMSHLSGGTKVEESIKAELMDIAGTINRTIDLIEQDTKLKACMEGRDLSQTTGKRNAQTTGRFPNLLHTQKMVIAASAIRKAQDNYNKKFREEVAKATKEASLDMAQFMCQKIGSTGTSAGTTGILPDMDFLAPYATYYDITGISLEALMSQSGSKTEGSLGGGASGSSVGFYIGGTSSTKADAGVTTTTTASFSRTTRMCHVCRSTTTKSCSSGGGTTVLFVHVGGKSSCSITGPIEKCEDLEM